MNKKANFIVTKDKETADKLITAGCKLVAESNGTYTFVNMQLENMDFDANNKMFFTNMLSL